MKNVMLGLIAIGLVTSPALAANRCRGANGKFVSCPKSGSSASASGATRDAKGRCHGAGGKFVKCPTK